MKQSSNLAQAMTFAGGFLGLIVGEAIRQGLGLGVPWGLLTAVIICICAAAAAYASEKLMARRAAGGAQ